MKNKVLVFDFDGTIADTFGQAMAAFNRLAGRYGLRKIEAQEAAGLRDKTSQELIDYLRIPVIKLPRMIVEIRRELHKVIAFVEPARGLREVLFQLSASGRTMGILTSNSLENVREFLIRNELELFDFINPSSKIWGKAKRIKTLMDRQRLKPDEFLYIGDETRDIEAARKAGVRIAAVSWGYGARKVLEACQPDYLLTRPEELLSLP